ncbi:CHAP domain-containing protein [Enterococcus faecalis]|nr:CHAP domain-containing protein [Enterococcus faecalis]EIR8762546.1 glucosaminidase domain-containing protein [Enterococcus faecalis]
MKKLITVYSTIILLSTAVPITAFAEETSNETETIETSQVVDETKPSETMEATSETQQTETSETSDSTEKTVETTESSKQSTSTTETVPDSSKEQPVATDETQPPIIVPETTPSVSMEQEIVSSETPNETVAQEPVVTIPYNTETIHFEKVKSTEEFVLQIGETARKVAKDNDLFASVMIAQAILESGSGSSDLSREPNFNLFGIKGDFNGQSVSFLTAEDNGTGQLYSIQSNFRKYPSYKESFEDYAKLLKDGVSWNTAIYTGTHKSVAKTYENATQALTGTYATDTQYNQKLNGLIETYHLTEFDQEKTITPSESDFPGYNGVNYDSGNSYAWGNCTQYVYNRITQLGKHIDLTMGNGQDWAETGRARGYEVTRKPKAGTAVSFPAGVLGADSTYGHVAFVEKVNKDGSILISEMNVKGLNVVSTRTIAAENTSMLSYVQPK